MISQGPALSRRALLRGVGMLGAGGALSVLPEFSWATPSVSPEAAWPRVTALLDRYVAGRRLPGAVASLGLGDAPPAMVLRGREGFDDADPMSPASLFRVYSMTKPITGMAAMMLIDEGRLGLDQELADIFPAFATMQVAVDPAKGFESRPAQARITMRHLLTHTAGFGYAGIGREQVSVELLRQGLAPAVISHRFIRGITPPVPVPGPDEFLRRAAMVPLLAEPGSRWRYSMSLDVLALVIDKLLGGAGFAGFLQERLFGPAGMNDTFFRVPESDARRLTTNYGMAHGLHRAIDRPANSVFLDGAPFAFGGAGLVSTPADYDRFLRMLVNRGMIDDRRVMSERAVMLGMSNLLPPGADTKGTQVAGAGFGAGGRVGLGPDEGTFGWSGAAGTVGFVNSRIGLRAGLYVQFMPPGSLPIQKEFMAAARDDIIERNTH